MKWQEWNGSKSDIEKSGRMHSHTCTSYGQLPHRPKGTRCEEHCASNVRAALWWEAKRDVHFIPWGVNQQWMLQLLGPTAAHPAVAGSTSLCLRPFCAGLEWNGRNEMAANQILKNPVECILILVHLMVNCHTGQRVPGVKNIVLRTCGQLCDGRQKGIYIYLNNMYHISFLSWCSILSLLLSLPVTYLRTPLQIWIPFDCGERNNQWFFGGFYNQL